MFNLLPRRNYFRRSRVLSNDYNLVFSSTLGIVITIIYTWGLFNIININENIPTDKNFFQIIIFIFTIKDLPQALTLITLGLLSNIFVIWKSHNRNILFMTINTDIFYTYSIIVAQLITFSVMTITTNETMIITMYKGIQTIISITLLFIYDDWNIIKSYISNSQQPIKQSHFLRIFIANFIILIALITVIFLFTFNKNPYPKMISIPTGFIINYIIICIFNRSICYLVANLENDRENQIFLIGQHLTRLSEYLNPD